jgi:hypothetical protein
LSFLDDDGAYCTWKMVMIPKTLETEGMLVVPRNNLDRLMKDFSSHSFS